MIKFYKIIKYMVKYIFRFKSYRERVRGRERRLEEESVNSGTLDAGAQSETGSTVL